jgi:Cu(I)/Ag(I) efflux system membrane fusion protein
MKQFKIIIMLFLLLAVAGCKNRKAVSTVQESLPDKVIYTCSMHPQIIREEPGDCPICGMKLIKKITSGVKVAEVTLDALLKPTNEFVLTSIPVTTIQKKEEAIEIEALGNIAYDTKEVGNVSSSVDGRIEKLWIFTVRNY